MTPSDLRDDGTALWNSSRVVRPVGSRIALGAVGRAAGAFRAPGAEVSFARSRRGPTPALSECAAGSASLIRTDLARYTVPR